MAGFEYMENKGEIQDALSRNKRMKSRSVSRSKNINPVKTFDKTFLVDHIFTNLEMSPMDLLSVIQNEYSSESDWRKRRLRNQDFVRGRQLGEIVYDAEIERWITQGQYLQRRGIPPLTYNVISKFVRSLTGQFREINTGNVVVCDVNDPRSNILSSVLTTCVDRIKKQNKWKDKDATNFKEKIIGGRPVFKVQWGSLKGMTKPDVRFRVVPADNFMVNPGVVDYEMENLHSTVELHHTTINDIMRNFANNDYDRGMSIKQGYYSNQGDKSKSSGHSAQQYDGSQRRNDSWFSQGADSSSYTYFEIWKEVSAYEASSYDPLDGIYRVYKYIDPSVAKAEIDEKNRLRIENMGDSASGDDFLIEYIKPEMKSRMYGIFMTPWGEILDVMESPFKDGTQPFVVTEPDINGEVWGIVEEIINPQKSMDRNIQLMDEMIQNAMKGFTWIPDTAIPDEYSNAEYLRKISTANGKMIYKVDEENPLVKPEQMYSDVSKLSGDVVNMIQLYSSLVDDISGNFGAAQGKSTANTASGYALETQNAGLNVRDIMDNYLSLIRDRDEKILELIQQSYTKDDYFKITGKEVDPMELADYYFRVEQSKGTNSAQHKLALEQELLQLVQGGLVPFKAFLEVSTNPAMIQLKQKMEEMESRAMEQQQQQPVQQQPLTNDASLANDPNSQQFNQQNIANSSPEQMK